MPAGYMSYDFLGKNNTTSYWTSTVDENGDPYQFGVDNYVGNSYGGFYLINGYSVRCIKNDYDNTPPRAILTIDRTIGTTNTAFQFDASQSYDHETLNENLLCRWDWDSDGNWDTEFNNQLVKTHVFNTRGIYTITIELKDEANSSGFNEQMVSVGDGSFVDDRDQNEYVFLSIGEQEWMAENLKYLPSINSIWKGSIEEAFYYVNQYYDERIEEAKTHKNYMTYGVLYNYVAAQSACPDGWHLPKDDDWMKLEQELGMSISQSRAIGWRSSGNVGYKLKTKTGWEYEGNGSNESLFTALPSGFWRPEWDDPTSGSSYEPGFDTDFWTNTERNETEALRRRLIHSQNSIYREYASKAYGFSVRCVKDE